MGFTFAKLPEVKDQLRRRRHDPIPVQGRWLTQVLRGHMAYYSVPGNSDAISAFRYPAVASIATATKCRIEATHAAHTAGQTPNDDLVRRRITAGRDEQLVAYGQDRAQPRFSARRWHRVRAHCTNLCTTTASRVLRRWRCGPGARSMASFQAVTLVPG